jgi:hypothetical protein
MQQYCPINLTACGSARPTNASEILDINRAIKKMPASAVDLKFLPFSEARNSAFLGGLNKSAIPHRASSHGAPLE